MAEVKIKNVKEAESRSWRFRDQKLAVGGQKSRKPEIGKVGTKKPELQTTSHRVQTERLRRGAQADVQASHFIVKGAPSNAESLCGEAPVPVAVVKSF